MSELTNERLEEYARDGRNAGDCEVEQMARELLALRTLRDAGDEVVGLLKWCWLMFDSSIIDLAADHDYGEGEHEARRIIEIVEGKHA